MFIYFTVAVLILVGGFLIFGVHPRDFENVFAGRREKRRQVRQLSRKRASRVSSAMSEAQRMLDEAGMGESMSTYRMMALVLMVGGFTFGMALNSILIAIILAVACAAIPLVVIRFRTANYVRELHENMQTAMSMVSSSYISNPDIITAVQNNITLIPPPLNGIFERFLVSTQLIDASVHNALLDLQDEIDNSYWIEWCGALIQCQTDSSLRYVLTSIVDRFGDHHRSWLDMESTLKKQVSDYVLTVMVVIGSIPIMCAMIPEWYNALFGTLAGQITLGVMLLVILATSVWISQLFKPVDGRGGKK